MKVINNTGKKVAFVSRHLYGMPQLETFKPEEVLDLEDVNPQKRYLSAALKAGFVKYDGNRPVGILEEKVEEKVEEKKVEEHAVQKEKKEKIKHKKRKWDE